MRLRRIKETAGTTRLRSGFLWLPKWIGGEYRWLEKAKWVEKVYIGFLGHKIGNMGLERYGDYPYWAPIKWVDE